MDYRIFSVRIRRSFCMRIYTAWGPRFIVSSKGALSDRFSAVTMTQRTHVANSIHQRRRRRGGKRISYQRVIRIIIYISCFCNETDKQETKPEHTWLTVSREEEERRKKNFISESSESWFCGSPLPLPPPQPYRQTGKHTAKSIWNIGLLIKSMLIFINFQTTFASLIPF